MTHGWEFRKKEERKAVPFVRIASTVRKKVFNYPSPVKTISAL
jgi:hypothetical protein